jgi:ribosomal protein S18 acetylase RimI-like enzyme
VSIEIAYVAEADVETLHACLDAVARENRYLALAEAPPLARSREFVLQNIASEVTQFVAREGPTVVGWCDILPGSAPAVRHCGSLGMGVLASHRGHGIGRRLLEASIAHACEHGITRIELSVRADNVPAIKLYERAGFVREGRQRHGMRFDGQYYDSWGMSLICEDAAHGFGLEQGARISIRGAGPADAPAIATIHEAAVRGATVKAHYSGAQIGAWAQPRMVSRLWEQIESRHFFVAMADGQPIAYAQLDPKAAVIRSIYVLPSFARRGVGRRLAQTMFDAARDAGLEQLQLDASLNAVAFYVTLGFRRLEDVDHELRSGVALRCVRMVKPLRPKGAA